MSIPRSTRFGPYEVVSPLGAGGMGEVYRARDTRLGRDVAIKILPEAFAADPDRVARFTREAQLLASLNHPNIAQIYGIEEGQGGSTALVMELVEGETLADRVAQGKLPVDDVLSIARQVADALEAAHERGVIHRDLKPANIKIRADGTVKVLDFGLAKLDARSAEELSPSPLSPTITSPALMTGVGVLLGTAAYMSPEQARGKPLDKRTDIWSFGAVLFELATGRRAFDGEDVADTLSKVLQAHPTLDSVPVRLRRLIAKCLQKNPKDRLRDIGDAWELLDDGAGVTANGQAGLWRSAAALMAVIAAATLVMWWAPWRAVPSAPEVIRFQISPPPGTTLANDVDDPPAVSPDGTRVAFLAMSADGRVRIWVRSLASLEARQLEGTEEAHWVVWSPNGKWIAFDSAIDLKKVPAAGGPTQVICSCPSILRGAWSPAGVLVLGSARGLFKVPEEGGLPTPLTTLDQSKRDVAHLVPSLLPDGRHVLYVRSGESEAGLYMASIDATPADQPVKRIFDTSAQYASGRLLFVRSGVLFSQPFDVDQLRLTGESTEIARVSTQVQPSMSGNGVLALGANPSQRQLTWFARDGKPLETIGQPGAVSTPRISPDDSRVAFVRYDTGPGDIWLYEPKRGEPYQFTSLEDREVPLWVDSGHIAYSLMIGGGFQLTKRAINGVGGEEGLSEPDAKSFLFTELSSDAKYALFVRTDPRTRTDVWTMALTGDRKATPVLNSQFNEVGSRLSPNGKWLAYVSDTLGRFDVYVTSFAPDSPSTATRGTWPISTTGGTRPVWSRDGTRLFFISPERKMMSVEVRNPAGPVPEFGRPVALFDARISGHPFELFDVASDGRFLMPVPSAQRESEPITVILNWPALGN